VHELPRGDSLHDETMIGDQGRQPDVMKGNASSIFTIE
jgi:hypothetical protein